MDIGVFANPSALPNIIHKMLVFALKSSDSTQKKDGDLWATNKRKSALYQSKKKSNTERDQEIYIYKAINKSKCYSTYSLRTAYDRSYKKTTKSYEIYQSAQASSILEPQPTRCWSRGTRHPKLQRSDPRIPSDQPGEET